jgi:hypothetical protein
MGKGQCRFARIPARAAKGAPVINFRLRRAAFSQRTLPHPGITLLRVHRSEIAEIEVKFTRAGEDWFCFAGPLAADARRGRGGLHPPDNRARARRGTHSRPANGGSRPPGPAGLARSHPAGIRAASPASRREPHGRTGSIIPPMARSATRRTAIAMPEWIRPQLVEALESSEWPNGCTRLNSTATACTARPKASGAPGGAPISIAARCGRCRRERRVLQVRPGPWPASLGAIVVDPELTAAFHFEDRDSRVIWRPWHRPVRRGGSRGHLDIRRHFQNNFAVAVCRVSDTMACRALAATASASSV